MRINGCMLTNMHVLGANSRPRSLDEMMTSPQARTQVRFGLCPALLRKKIRLTHSMALLLLLSFCHTSYPSIACSLTHTIGLSS